MTQATLMFGVGATKAGTSWLYRYLLEHPDCHLRSIKELHFFDTLDDNSQEARIAALTKRRDALDRKMNGVSNGELVQQVRNVADIDEFTDVIRSGRDADYMAYLTGGRGNQRLIADITPAYSLLSEGRLKGMAGMSADVRFVYLLRDPVARLWSHVRMIAFRRGARGRDMERHAGDILERALSGGETHITRRGDYRDALTRLTASVAPGRLFVGFYEDLFSGDALERLCAFLGISPQPADRSRRVHEGTPLAISPSQQVRAASFLKDQYEFVAAGFGPLPPEWEENRGRGLA